MKKEEDNQLTLFMIRISFLWGQALSHKHTVKKLVFAYQILKVLCHHGHEWDLQGDCVLSLGYVLLPRLLNGFVLLYVGIKSEPYAYVRRKPGSLSELAPAVEPPS